MKILIVDDDPITRETLRGILGKERSWQVDDAGDGEIAWEMLQNGYKPDLCIIDLMMPRLDGMGLLEKMREEPRFAAIRSMMVTLTSDRSVVVKAIEMKVSGYLLKPFTAARVIAQVRKIEATLPQPREEDEDVILRAPEIILKRLDISHKRYLEVLDILIGTLQSGIQEIEQALDQMDILSAISRLDGMKGACVTLGANRFQAVAANAKLDGQEDDLGNLQAALEDLISKRADFADRFENLGLLREEAETLGGEDLDDYAEGQKSIRDIVVVEDKAAIIEQMQRSLKSDAWRITGVSQPNKAMERLMQSQPDLVILSLSLENDGAFNLFRFLRSSGKTQHIPVFGMSIKTNAAEQEKAKERGIDAIITKPIDYRAMKGRLERLFELDTSDRFYQIKDDGLFIEFPEACDAGVIGELESYLQDKLSDAINQGAGHVVFNMLALSSLDMDLVRLIFESIERCDSLSLKHYLIGTDALRESGKEYEETKGWDFHPSVEAALETTETTPAAG